jgi:flagellar hook assembly protein FlgD
VGSSERGNAQAVIRNGANAVVATLDAVLFGAGASITWDGRDTGGTVVPDGIYSVAFTAADPVGNVSAPQTRSVEVYKALALVKATPALFFPQDGDTLAPSTTLGFTLLDPATVTWTITNTAGAVVRTIKTAEALAAGVYTFKWDGRNDLGRYVPRGYYRSTINSGNGAVAVKQYASVLADAFKIASSDTTPGRGQKITITVTTVEKLSTAPRLYVVQPGRTTWSVGVIKQNATTYRATITVKTGAVGTVKFKAQAKDSKAKLQYSVLALPLH